VMRAAAEQKQEQQNTMIACAGGVLSCTQ
jgi:hypothetical protein